jgi:N-acyl-D-aspartate/D-glutamate deacylase
LETGQRKPAEPGLSTRRNHSLFGDAGVDFMKERGRMQEGMAADIVIFDPDSIDDTTVRPQQD